MVTEGEPADLSSTGAGVQLSQSRPSLCLNLSRHSTAKNGFHGLRTLMIVP